MQLKDKVALITGAMSGIGQAIACRFADEGADIAIHDLTVEKPDSEKEMQTPDMIRQRGRRVETYQVDVSKVDQVRLAISKTIEDFGRIHILVNDAGTATRRHPFSFPDSEWEKTIGVNLTGTWNYCRCLGPHLIENCGSSIVNITSLCSFAGSYFREPYVASKGGVALLTYSLALDMAEAGVRVNAVAPGPVLTAMPGKALKDKVPGRMTPEMVYALVPMRRWAKPEEVAAAVLFLASDEASFITGHTLVVDGGMTAGNQIGVPWKPEPLDDADLPWILNSDS